MADFIAHNKDEPMLSKKSSQTEQMVDLKEGIGKHRVLSLVDIQRHR